MALEVAEIRLEAFTPSHFDGEKVVVVLLGLPARGVLSEGRFDYLLEVVDRIRRQRVENPRPRFSSWTKRLVTGADRCDTSMPLTRGQHSRGREQLALYRDLIGFLTPLSTPCR